MTTEKITFEEFWKKYPLHRARVDALKVWNRMSPEDKNAAFEGVDLYREFCESHPKVAIKYAQGWLNGRRWEDEYDEHQVSGKTNDTIATPPADTTVKEVW